VPFVDRALAGQDGRAAAVAFLEDFLAIAAGTGVERIEPPILENEELSAIESGPDAGLAGGAAGRRKLGEQLGEALLGEALLEP
jgi:hypothetical protein